VACGKELNDGQRKSPKQLGDYSEGHSIEALCAAGNLESRGEVGEYRGSRDRQLVDGRGSKAGSRLRTKTMGGE
jgi:hypothetical protein